MNSEDQRMPASARKAIRRAVMFAPERILSMACILGLTRSQIESVKRIVRGGDVSREAMGELIEVAAKELEHAFEADPLDTAAILTAALIVQQGDGGRFARMLLDAAIVRGHLTGAQRRAASLTLNALSSVSPSAIGSTEVMAGGRDDTLSDINGASPPRGPSLFGYARDRAVSVGDAE